MRKKIFGTLILSGIALGVVIRGGPIQSVQSQQRAGLTSEVIARRNSVEQELQSIAIVER